MCFAGLEIGQADLLDAQGNAFSCAVSTASATALTCTVPDAPAARYQLRIFTASGYASSSPTLTLAPRLTSVSPAAGSLAGGLSVTLQATAAPFDSAAPSNNQVFVGGLPCKVQNVTATQLSCETPRVVGVVPTVVRIIADLLKSTPL